MSKNNVVKLHQVFGHCCRGPGVYSSGSDAWGGPAVASAVPDGPDVHVNGVSRAGTHCRSLEFVLVNADESRAS